MQKGHRIDFQTQTTNFKELEKEFTKSLHSGSIIVLDIYTDWVGSCKVVVPYFQKLYLEANEFCPISFVCVNSDQVIASLENAGFPLSLYKTKNLKSPQPSPQQAPQTPPKKQNNNLNDSLFADLLSPSSSVNNSMVLQEGQTNETPMASISPIEKSDSNISNLNISNIENLSKSMDESMQDRSMRSSLVIDSSNQHPFSDIDRQSWVPLIASVRGKSCPRFLFYKGGKLMEDVSGVNISRINSILKRLIDLYNKEKTEEGDEYDQPLNDNSLLSDRVNIDSHLDDSSLDF
ncbi:predicted protein [Naegleria gruberi]|uniref:Predicted protein n=1 Tax=Naegleria gruberi TaxID=5762 RepID=D2UZM2_NAEGR|nr:uncharacterized protein NAEGRDRAFT_61991 [Naegleria gruberi]EFC50181.1 predicted protein [Naegleria gruberi]|eukprot:XP_002682925.1 predicted protein [Naegleria gruberi strain NEG-M]